MPAIFPRTESDPVAEADLAAHAADTTGIHGIVDTGALVLTNDARLTDQRVPTAGSVTDAKVAVGAAIAYSKLNLTGAIVNGDLAGSIDPTKIAGTALTLAGGTLTGPLLLPNGLSSAPAIAFSAETNTGIYRQASADIRFVVGGGTKASLTNNGLESSSGFRLTGASSNLSWTALTSATTVGLAIKVSGDAANRFTLRADGGLVWGDGTAALDILMRRDTATALRIRNAADNADADLFLAQLVANNKVQVPVGAVGSPTYTFQGDTDTGVYSPTANELAVTVGGGQRLHLDGVGRLGVNVAVSTTSQLVFGGLVGGFNTASTVVGQSGPSPNNAGTGSVYGIEVVPLTSYAGAVSEVRGVNAGVRTANASAVLAGGKAFNARAPVITLGAITTAYGLYIEQQKVAGVTTGWGIYQADAGDFNRFFGQVQGGDGTAGAPSYAFANDPNTGIYSQGADSIGFATNGAERMRVNSAGNIILGPGAGAGGGARCIAMDNAGTVPNANPASGGVLYAEAGALKWRGSSGTVTTLAVA